MNVIGYIISSIKYVKLESGIGGDNAYLLGEFGRTEFWEPHLMGISACLKGRFSW